jgi:hypothetical protein
MPRKNCAGWIFVPVDAKQPYYISSIGYGEAGSDYGTEGIPARRRVNQPGKPGWLPTDPDVRD